jgi:hypothetical protein
MPIIEKRLGAAYRWPMAEATMGVPITAPEYQYYSLVMFVLVEVYVARHR